MSTPTTPYVGRLVCDGEGNLLADEGEFAGLPVYHDPESNAYLFVEEGGASHNDRHHTGFGVVQGTQESDPHHVFPTEDDPHHDATAPNFTRIRFNPDALAATVTGHTEAYTNV